MGDVVTLGILRANPAPGVLWPQHRARRCLFGPPDPERTSDFLERETRKLQERNREKWNFDFEEERPLKAGRYEWTAVKGSDVSLEKSEEATEDYVKPTEKKLEQKRITDFMRKRKRSLNPTEKSTEKSTSSEPEAKTARRFST